MPRSCPILSSLTLLAIKSGTLVMEVKTDCTVRRPQTSYRTISCRTGASRTKAGRNGFFSELGPTLSSSLAFHTVPLFSPCWTAAPLSRAYLTSSLPGSRVMLGPSPKSGQPIILLCSFYPQNSFSPFRVQLECHCHPKAAHHPPVSTPLPLEATRIRLVPLFQQLFYTIKCKII